MVMEHISRISISLPSNLLKRFDDHIKRLGYETRSKALQEAMHLLITESKWACEKMGMGIGALTMVYDHSVKGLEEDLNEIQHRYRKVIASNMHIHLDEDNCLEIVAVRGNSLDIRGLAQELRTRRGVKELKLAITTP